MITMLDYLNCICWLENFNCYGTCIYALVCESCQKYTSLNFHNLWNSSSYADEHVTFIDLNVELSFTITVIENSMLYTCVYPVIS